jgi:chemotaxis protein methyltransferase CheR
MSAREPEVGTLSMPTMSDRDFHALRDLVREATGIVLADSKRTMLASRLASRLRVLKLGSFQAYREQLSDPAAFKRERQHFINAVTTNKTSFFREGHQFEVLARELVPQWIQRAQRTGNRRVRVWSAACSSGEEPWTVAMVLRETLPNPDAWDVKILATDIDTDVLAKAERGVYDTSRMEGLSRERLLKHFVAGRGEQAGLVAVNEELKRWVTFRQLNFMDPSWPIRTTFDLVLCRNASIYFDQPTQKTLFGRLAALIEPGGNLFVGHAEVLHWPELPLEAAAGGVYRRTGGASVAPGAGSAPPRQPPRAPAPPPSPAPARGAPTGRPVLSSVRAPALLKTRGAPARGDLELVVINVGEMHASDRPVEIKTLLGSCVAACLYDPVTRIGGMNHFLLPESADHGGDPARFGVHAMEMLINALMKLGADRRRLEGKLFGGGNVLGSVARRPTVGERNSAFAREFLAREGIPIRGERLLSDCGTDVRFWPHEGRVFIRDIATTLLDLSREKVAPVLPATGGDAELF